MSTGGDLIRNIPTLAGLTGRAAYEASVRVQPTYQDGTPRKRWEELSRAVQVGWERPNRHTPPVHPEARFNLCTDP